MPRRGIAKYIGQIEQDLLHIITDPLAGQQFRHTDELQYRRQDSGQLLFIRLKATTGGQIQQAAGHLKNLGVGIST